MAKEKDIPTLTSIVHAGDDSMHNHFDTHQFNNGNEDINTTHLTENATLLENTEFEDTEFEDIPSITLDDDFLTEEPAEDFSDTTQSDIHNKTGNDFEENKTDKNRSVENTLTAEEIKEKIDLAIADALPWIELNLKKQLYKKFDI